jgi:hypothetical protein
MMNSYLRFAHRPLSAIHGLRGIGASLRGTG